MTDETRRAMTGDQLLELALTLYPRGPGQGNIWERAGGGLAELDLSGNGRDQWWSALRLIRLGGGQISADQLLAAFARDYPGNPKLAGYIRPHSAAPGSGGRTYQIDVLSASGVQIGDGNVQINNLYAPRQTAPGGQSAGGRQHPLRAGSTTKRAFVSYADHDAARGRQIQFALDAVGVPVWREADDLPLGQVRRTAIRREITENALVFIACFSSVSVSVQQSQQHEELLLAIDHQRQLSPERRWLIPARLDECRIPDIDIGGGRTLDQIRQADLFGERADAEMSRLVRAVLGSIQA